MGKEIWWGECWWTSLLEPWGNKYVSRGNPNLRALWPGREVKVEEREIIGGE